MSLRPRTTTEPRRLLSDHVRDELLHAIHSGELQLGEKLPVENALCELFGVSRMTIREAVRSLVEAGYLNRIQGSGTYVAFRPSARHTLERNLSYTRLIEEAGMRFGLRLCNVLTAVADRREMKRLGLSPGAKVVRVERVRYADDRPVIYSIDSVPVPVLGGDVTDETLTGSLHTLLGRLGHEVATAEATLLPVLADSIQAEVLEVEIGSPLLHIGQVDSTTTGAKVLHSLEWHVPGMFELTLLRRAH